MYSCAPYATASGFVELPYLLLQSAVFMPITYWMIGFEANAAKFFFFWLVFLMALTLNTFLGQLLVMVTPSQQVGQLLGSGGLASSTCCSSSPPCIYVLSLFARFLLECSLRSASNPQPASRWGGFGWDPFASFSSFCCLSSVNQGLYTVIVFFSCS